MLAKAMQCHSESPETPPRHGALGLEGTCYSPHNLMFCDVEVQSRAKMHTFATSSSPQVLKGRVAVGQHPTSTTARRQCRLSDRLGARYAL